MPAKRDIIKTEIRNTSRTVVVATKTKTTSEVRPLVCRAQQLGLKTLHFVILASDLIILKFHSERLPNTSN